MIYVQNDRDACHFWCGTYESNQCQINVKNFATTKAPKKLQQTNEKAIATEMHNKAMPKRGNISAVYTIIKKKMKKKLQPKYERSHNK